MRHAVTGGLLLLLCLASPPLARPVPPAIPELDRDAYAALLAEHRGLSSIYQSYDAEEVAVVAVSVDNDLGRLQRFVSEQELTYPVYQGDLDLKREQGTFMIPLTLVYSPDGALAERHVGYVAPQQLEDDVLRHLPPAPRLPDSPEPAGTLAQNLIGGEHPL